METGSTMDLEIAVRGALPCVQLAHIPELFRPISEVSGLRVKRIPRQGA